MMVNVHIDMGKPTMTHNDNASTPLSQYTHTISLRSLTRSDPYVNR